MANLLGPAVTGITSKLFGPAMGTAAGTGINSVISALQSAAKPAGGSYTTGVNNPLNSSTQPTTPQPTSSPSPPGLDLTTPDIPQISWDEAFSRAKARYEPQYESAVMSQDKLASDQQKRLTQALSAKGYADARGGHALTGGHDITQAHGMALDNLRNQYDSLINAYAGDIYSGESTGAAQKLNALLSDRDAKNANLLQQYGLDLGASLQRETNEINRYGNYYNSFLDMILAALGMEAD